MVEPVAPGRVESDVLPLWREGMSDSRIVDEVPRRHAWLYRSHPHGPAQAWVVRDGRHGEPLGTTAIIPQHLVIDGRLHRAGMVVDFVVSAKARLAGPAVSLQREVMRRAGEHGFEFLIGSPNNKAWPVFARLGYRAVCAMNAYAKPLHHDTERMARVLGPLLPARLAPVARAVATPASHAVQVALRALELAAGWMTRLRGLQVRSGPVRMPLPRLDGATADAPAIDAAADPAVRDWRYAQHPTHDYRLVEVVGGGRTLAWAVIRLREGMAEVQDMASLAARPDAETALWWLLPRVARDAGARVLAVIWGGNEALGARLKRCLYLRRVDTRRFMVLPPKGAPAGFAERLVDPSSWRLFSGQLDI